MIRTTAVYIAAAFVEIAGCYGSWAWFAPGEDRRAGAARDAVAGDVRVAAHAGRKQRGGPCVPAYGGVYIAASLLWLWQVEGVKPDRWDVIGSAVGLIGAAIIVSAPRAPAVAS
jgi:small multidrug resistance family-3 protein